MKQRTAVNLDLQPLGEHDMVSVLSLNQHWVPHVGSLDEQSLAALMDEATVALGAWRSTPVRRSGGGGSRRDAAKELCGFVIVLADGAEYSSPNYRYFSARHDRFAYVDRIAVSSSAQGRGVGRCLYDAVVAFARGSGAPVLCAEVNLDPPNPESQVFHSNYGFVEVGRQWTYGDTVQVQLLELALP